VTGKVTPENLIKYQILLDAMKDGVFSHVEIELENESIDMAYDDLVESDEHWDFEYEFRESGEETEVDAPWSRHYEAKSVARKVAGTWVGWTYWYGGGKHGNADEIEWMSEAYFLNCTEQEVTVIKRTFEKVSK